MVLVFRSLPLELPHFPYHHLRQPQQNMRNRPAMHPRILRPQLHKIMRLQLPSRLLHQHSRSNLRFMHARMRQLPDSLFLHRLQPHSRNLEQLHLLPLLLASAKILHNNRMRILMSNRHVPEFNYLPKLLNSVPDLHNNSLKLPDLCKRVLQKQRHLRGPMSIRHDSPVYKWLSGVCQLQFYFSLPGDAFDLHHHAVCG